NRRSGELIGQPSEVRTAEQQEQRKQTLALIPQYEKELAEGERLKLLTPLEAQHGRRLLERAKVTGDLTAYETFQASVIKGREKAAEIQARRGAGGGRKLEETETDVPAKQITNYDALKGYQKGVNGIVDRLSKLKSWQVATPEQRAEAVQEEFLKTHHI